MVRSTQLRSAGNGWGMLAYRCWDHSPAECWVEWVLRLAVLQLHTHAHFTNSHFLLLHWVNGLFVIHFVNYVCIYVIILRIFIYHDSGANIIPWTSFWNPYLQYVSNFQRLLADLGTTPPRPSSTYTSPIHSSTYTSHYPLPPTPPLSSSSHTSPIHSSTHCSTHTVTPGGKLL